MIRPFCCLRGWVRPGQGALYAGVPLVNWQRRAGNSWVGRKVAPKGCPTRLWRSSLLAAVVAIPELRIDPKGARSAIG